MANFDGEGLRGKRRFAICKKRGFNLNGYDLPLWAPVSFKVSISNGYVSFNRAYDLAADTILRFAASRVLTARLPFQLGACG